MVVNTDNWNLLKTHKHVKMLNYQKDTKCFLNLIQCIWRSGYHDHSLFQLILIKYIAQKIDTSPTQPYPEKKKATFFFAFEHISFQCVLLKILPRCAFQPTNQLTFHSRVKLKNYLWICTEKLEVCVFTTYNYSYISCWCILKNIKMISSIKLVPVADTPDSYICTINLHFSVLLHNELDDKLVSS